MQTVTQLPFNKLLGLQTAESPNVLKLPAGGQYLNHLGTVHASAQLALAEASSGEYLLSVLGSLPDIVPVVRRLEAKFRKPASGVIKSTVTTALEKIEEFKAELAAKNRAIVTITVELRDEKGDHTLSASIDWFISRFPNQTAA
jgi:hypothetical protein